MTARAASTGRVGAGRTGPSPDGCKSGFESKWVFITGGCSGRGVQWMGVVVYNKLVYNII